MSLFDNSKPYEFLFFVRDFQMNIEASGTLIGGVKTQFLSTQLCGEALRHLDTFSVEVVSMIIAHLNCNNLGLGI